MSASACVAIAPCGPPTVPPGADAVFVDPQAALGGGGSAQAPLRSVPETRPGMTVVLAPGTHPGPIRVRQPNVRLVGHGTCSVVTATGAVDVVGVDATDVRIEGLRLIAEGEGRALIIYDTGSATVSRSLVESNDRVMGAGGFVSVRESRFVHTSLCGDACEVITASVDLVNGGELQEVDISGPGPLRLRNRGAVVRDTRLGGDRGFYGLLALNVPELTVSRVAVFGAFNGILAESAGATDIAITDLLIRTPPAEVVELAAGISALLHDPDSSLQLRRADIQGGGEVGVSVLDTRAALEDVRIAGFLDGLELLLAPSRGEVTLSRAWIDYTEFGAYLRGTGPVSLSDLYIRGCSDCVTYTGQVLAALRSTSPLSAERLHLVAQSTPGLISRTDASIDDLSVTLALRNSREAAVEATGFLRGRRWDVQGDGVGLMIDLDFGLRNVSLRPVAGAQLTPVCLQAGAFGVLSDFDVRRSSDRPSIMLQELNGEVGRVDALRIEHGTLLTDRVVEHGGDCIVSLGTQPKELPQLHNVAQR